MQSISQCSSSDDHIPINERKWEDITANEYSSKYDLEHHVFKFVGQLVRHEKSSSQRSRWSISLEIDTSEAEIYVLEARRRSIISGREAARHDFSIARILVTFYCTFELFRCTRRDLIEAELKGHVAIPFKWK